MEFNSLVNKVPFMYCIYMYSCMSMKTAEESRWLVNLASVVLAVRIMKPCILVITGRMHDIVGTSLSQWRYSAFCSGTCARLLHFEPGCVSEMVSVTGIEKSNLHPLAFVVMCYMQYSQHIQAARTKV